MLATLQSEAHRKETTIVILFLHHIILQTPTFMHHRGSTLSLMWFMKRDYKGKSEANISHWQKYAAYTKVIFQLKNNYSSSKPFVSMCFVVLTKRRGPFITMNGGRHCGFLLYYTSAYSATVSAAWIFGFDTVVICGVWFMILWARKTNLSCMCKYFTLEKTFALRNSVHWVKLNRSGGTTPGLWLFMLLLLQYISHNWTTKRSCKINQRGLEIINRNRN